MPASAGAIADFQVRGMHQRGAVVPARAAAAASPHCLATASRPRGRSQTIAGADAGHVIDQRGAQRGHQQIDRPVRPALFQDPHHGVAADEVADPHIGNDQDRPGVVRVLDLRPDIVNL